MYVERIGQPNSAGANTRNHLKSVAGRSQSRDAPGFLLTDVDDGECHSHISEMRLSYASVVISAPSPP